MSELKLTGRTVRASPTLEILVEEIEGSVDATTARSFENALKQVIDAGHRNIIFVFTKVGAINSSGMGSLLQCADRIRASGGEISLVNVAPDVISLFESLGLLPILPVHSSEEEAIAYIQEKLGKEQATAAESSPAAPGTSPPPAAAEREVAPAAAAETAAEEGAEEADEETGLYPLELTCPDCEKDLEIEQYGYYRCPGCGCYFVAEEDGNVQAVRLDESKVAELRLPADASMAGGIRQLAASLVDGLGYTEEVQAGIDRCIDRAWLWAARWVQGIGKRVHLFVAANPDEWAAGLTVPEGSADGPPSIEDLKGLADQVDISPIPTGGHVLRLCIKIGAEGEVS